MSAFLHGCSCDCRAADADAGDLSRDICTVAADDDAPIFVARPSTAVMATTAAFTSNEPESQVARALKAVRDQYPYLMDPEHYLHAGIAACEAALAAGDEDAAADLLIRVEQEVYQEEDTLAVAFNLFKQGRQDALAQKQVRFMLEYLGFPSDDKDANRLINAVDSDNDKVVSLVEFQMYVGRMGGSFRLFQKRRGQKRALRSGLFGADEGDEEKEQLREDLFEAGFQEAAQAYWRLVMPISELRAAACLQSCQKSALRHIRAIAKSNHERSLSNLQMRMMNLGHKDSQLWMTLAWIRELAPIIIQVDFDGMIGPCRGDTHYRNQFETGVSGGLLHDEVRKKWERNLFSGAYDSPDVTPFDRVKYGVIDPMNDFRGVARTEQYGDSYFVLKDVRLRVTLSSEDSSNVVADRLAVLDYYAHVLMEYTDTELQEVVRVANSGGTDAVGTSSMIRTLKYKEVQIHGEIEFAKHIDRLVAADRHKEGYMPIVMKEVCDKFGWKLNYVSDERARREKDGISRVGRKAWKKYLEKIAEREDSTPPVPDCFCRKGCGRPVRPGLTKNGKPFVTCCKGCAMGFGHDTTCAQDAAEETDELGVARPKSKGPGFCKHRCGRPVNPGRTLAGRLFDTCCKGCARGKHDRSCGVIVGNEVIEPGMCRMACGRTVGVYKSGRKADICCKGCSLGEDHSTFCNRKHRKKG